MNVFMHAQVRQNLNAKLQLVRTTIDQDITALNSLKTQLAEEKARKARHETQGAHELTEKQACVERKRVAHQQAVAIPMHHVPLEPQRPAGMIDCNATNGNEYWQAHLEHNKISVHTNPQYFWYVNNFYVLISGNEWPKVKQYKADKATYDAAVAHNNQRQQQVDAADREHQNAIADERAQRERATGRVEASDREIHRLTTEINQLKTKISAMIKVEGLLAKMLAEESNKASRINPYVAALESHAANQDLPAQINLRGTIHLIRTTNQQLFAASQTKWARFEREAQSPGTLLAIGALMLTMLATREITPLNIMTALIFMVIAYQLGNGAKERLDNAENELASITQLIESVSIKATEFMDKLMNLAELTSQTALNELAGMRRVAQDGINLADRHMVRTGIFAEETKRILDARARDFAAATIEHGRQVRAGIEGMCTIL